MIGSALPIHSGSIPGAGVGQPHRLDLNGEAHRSALVGGQKLNPTPQGQNFPEHHDQEPPNPGGWTTQEQAFQERGKGWERRDGKSWSQFKDGGAAEEANLGAVLIDQDLPKGPKTSTSAPKDSWGRAAVAHEQAALFEEAHSGGHSDQVPELSRLMQEGDFEGAPTPPKKTRRSYRVVTPF